MKCPRCEATELDKLSFGRATTVDWCPDCGGAWYEEGELERALGLDRPVSVAEEGQGLQPGLICPCCDRPMAEASWPRQGTVRIDSCTQCGGRWLNRGELEGVRDVLRDAGELSFPLAGHLSGQPVHVPVAELRTAVRRLQPRWIVIGAVSMVVIYGFILGALRFGSLFDAMSSAPQQTGPGLAAAAGLVAFPVGGFIVGRGSSGFTIWEAAIAALPATALMTLSNGDELGGAMAAGLAIAGFALALFGAVIGERSSSD